MLTLLIVEPDPAIRELLSDMLYFEGYRVVTTEQRPSIDLICRARPDAVIMELPPMAPEPAIQLIAQLRARDGMDGLSILATTTNSRLLDDLRLRLDQMRCDVLLKPFDLHVLLSWAAALPPTSR